MKKSTLTLGMLLAGTVLLSGCSGATQVSSGQNVTNSNPTSSSSVSTEKLSHKYNVIFEMDIPDDSPTAHRWEAGLTNIRNLMAEFGPDVQIELVAHGAADGLFLKNPVKNAQGIVSNNVPAYEKELKDLSDKGVLLRMCRNTMKKIGATENDLYPFVKTVQTGVGEVVKREAEGWQYIKAE